MMVEIPTSFVNWDVTLQRNAIFSAMVSANYTLWEQANILLLVLDVTLYWVVL
jgi:hypothetical protein